MSKELYESDETFYSRWLEGKLTEEEKKRLEESGEEALLQSIVLHADSWSLPELDASLLEKVKEKTIRRKSKVISLKPMLAWAAAATMALVIALAYYLTSSREELIQGSDVLGSIQAAKLPDGNQAQVFAFSELTYSKDFLKDKTVHSKGLIYFDIQKKGPFIVETAMGRVEVKGTQFDVLNTDNALMVSCYEGKVTCTPSKGNPYILIPGQRFYYYKNTQRIAIDSLAPDKPEWLSGSQSFQQASLISVMEHLKVHFNISFELKEGLDVNRVFTGKYYLNNLEDALESVFKPFGMQAELKVLDGKKTVVLQ
ncbi:MAG: FecR family protein [Cytophagaceae bacterium]|jgi:ferric-dicitrate binding protein FerR (iron transport regulator)|nr:FecR family protein [Cytophagaceae bacterium]